MMKIVQARKASSFHSLKNAIPCCTIFFENLIFAAYKQGRPYIAETGKGHAIIYSTP